MSLISTGGGGDGGGGDDAVVALSKIDQIFEDSQFLDISDHVLSTPVDLPTNSMFITEQLVTIPGSAIPAGHRIFIDIEWHNYNGTGIASDNWNRAFLSLSLLNDAQLAEYESTTPLSFTDATPATLTTIELQHTSCSHNIHSGIYEFGILHPTLGTGAVIIPRGCMTKSFTCGNGGDAASGDIPIYHHSTELDLWDPNNETRFTAAATQCDGTDRYVCFYALNARGTTIDAGSVLNTMKRLRIVAAPAWSLDHAILVRGH